MSIERCHRCEKQIDTDQEDDCYRRVGEDMEPVCNSCRDKIDEEDEALASQYRAEYDAAPLSERNPTQYRQDLKEAGRGHLLPETWEE